MRLGRVEFSVGYVVDLDNPGIVFYAEDAVYSDLCNIIKYDQMHRHIRVVDALPTDTPEDIPEFLREPTTEEGTA